MNQSETKMSSAVTLDSLHQCSNVSSSLIHIIFMNNINYNRRPPLGVQVF